MSVGDTRSALRALGAALRGLLVLRWMRWLLACAVVVVGARVALGWILAAAADRAARRADLACSWEDLDLSLLTGRAEVSYLELRPRSAPPSASPLLSVEYGVFDLDLLPLLRGDLRIRRAEVDGADLVLERDAAGTWSTSRYLHPAAPVAPETAAEPAADAQEPPGFDLAPPLAIDALRLQHLRLHLADRAVDPPVDLKLEVTAALSNLGTPGRPARFSAFLTADGLLDGASLSGQATATSDALRVTLGAQAGSLRPRALAPYLAALDLRPACESLACGLQAELELAVIGERRDALRARLALSRVRIDADGRESLALDRLDAALDSISAARAALPRIELAGLRARAAREPEGVLRVAGLDLLPSPPSAGPPQPWSGPLMDTLGLLRPADLPRWARLLGRKDPDAYPWTLGGFSLSGGEVELADRSVDPPADLHLLIDAVELGEVVHDPSGEPRPIPFDLRLRAPGTADSIRLHGSLGPFAPARSIDLALEVEGVGLGTVEGYLLSAGLASALERGSFRVSLKGQALTDDAGRTEGSLELGEVALSGEEELLGVRSVTARDLVYDPSVPLLRAGDVEIEGPRLALARDPSRRMFALGMRTLGLAPPEEAAEAAPLGAPAPVPAAPGAAPGAPPAAPAPPVVFQIGRLAWTDSRVELTDRLVDPPRRFVLGELGFELEDLTLGGDPDGPPPEPARFTARAVSDELLEELTLDGLVRSRPGPRIDLTAELALRGRGLHGALLAPYLREFGVEPALENATLSLDLALGLREEEQSWGVQLDVRGASLTEDGAPLLSLDELRLHDVQFGETFELGELALVKPFVLCARDDLGVTSIAGWRLIGGAQGEAQPAPAAAAPPAAAPAPALPVLPPLLVHALSIEAGRLAWRAPDLSLELDIDVRASELGTLGAPGKLDLRLAVPGALEALALSAELALGPEELALRGALDARGIRAGPLAPLMPPGVELQEPGARLAFELDASVRAAQPAGLAYGFDLRELELGAGDAEPCLALAQAVLDVPRHDPAAGVLELGALRVTGGRLDARRDAEGAWHLGALRLGSAPESAAAPAAPAAEAAPAPRGSGLKRIALLSELSLALERFRVRDETRGPGARPLEGRLELALAGPAVLLDPNAPELPPLAWRVGGALDGLVADWSIAGTASPFAPEPEVALSLAASGVRTAGLAELLPALGAGASGEVEDGVLEGRMRAVFDVRRARPNELGFEHPFGGDVVLEGLALRDGPGGRVVLGLDRLAAELQRVDTAQGLVHVRTLELERPRGVVVHADDGWHACGFCFGRPTQAATPAVTDGAARGVAVEAASPPPAERKEREEGRTSGDPGGELRIDEFLVSGIDALLRDETEEPALVIPLTELDLEVKRFTTRAFEERLPIQVNGRLETSPPDGAAPVFDGLETAGRFSLGPAREGWAQLSLTGLELKRFSGLTEREGVSLNDGSLDGSVRWRFKGEDGAQIETTLVFTDLDAKEPKGGPLERVFSLPMTLDSVLFLLRNQDGEHRFSLAFPAGAGTGDMVLAGTRAFGELLARALAAAPLRLVGAVIPGGGGEHEKKAPRSVGLAFAPGATELPPDAPGALSGVQRELARRGGLSVRLVHELGAGDLEHAERLANPPPERCLELVARLRQRRAELSRRADELTREARASYAVGAREAAAATEALREVERELAASEQSLDGVLEVLRTDTQRQRAKRTRAASREIGELRVAAAGEALRAGLYGPERERIELVAPRFEVVPGLAGGRVRIELVEP